MFAGCFVLRKGERGRGECVKQRCYEVARLIEWKMKEMKLNNF